MVDHKGLPTFVVERTNEGVPFESPYSSSDFATTEDIASALEKQMEILNLAFRDTPFTFSHRNRENRSIVDNAVWTVLSLDNLKKMKEAVGTADLTVLDVFLVSELSSAEIEIDNLADV